jgi:hypothetical protein
MTHEGEPVTDLTRVLMDIREIKVLLTERQKGVDKNAEDIARAFAEIAALSRMCHRMSWIASTATAILGAAAIKFFLG